MGTLLLNEETEQQLAEFKDCKNGQVVKYPLELGSLHNVLKSGGPPSENVCNSGRDR